MSRRHLDANIIHLEPGSRIQAHAGPTSMSCGILHGDGQLLTKVGMPALRPGELVWLPHLSMKREIATGDEGLTYLTVHLRQPGITIQPVPQQT